LARHLNEKYRTLLFKQDTCAIYSLREPPSNGHNADAAHDFLRMSPLTRAWRTLSRAIGLHNTDDTHAGSLNGNTGTAQMPPHDRQEDRL